MLLLIRAIQCDSQTELPSVFRPSLAYCEKKKSAHRDYTVSTANKGAAHSYTNRPRQQKGAFRVRWCYDLRNRTLQAMADRIQKMICETHIACIIVRIAVNTERGGGGGGEGGRQRRTTDQACPDSIQT